MRVVLQKHEVPGVERRPEIDERNVVGAAVDLDFDLERGHQYPIEGKENNERPKAKDGIDSDFRRRRHILKALRLEQTAHEAAGYRPCRSLKSPRPADHVVEERHAGDRRHKKQEIANRR